MGAPSRTRVCAGATPGRMRVPHRRPGRGGATPGGVVNPHCNDGRTRAGVTCLRADLYTTLDQGSRAIAVGLEYLRHVDVDWSPHPTEDEARCEYERIWSQLGSRTIEDLIDLPLMSYPVALATLDVLSKMTTPALYTDANLYLLVVCRQVTLSLAHGNCDASCFAYEWLAMVAGARFGDYRAAYSFGRLGYDLVEQRGMKRFQARTYMIFGNLIIPWTRHVKSGRDLLRRSPVSTAIFKSVRRRSGAWLNQTSSGSHFLTLMVALSRPTMPFSTQ
jgi:predicted ATPase